jgi:hypothetical protein
VSDGRASDGRGRPPDSSAPRDTPDTAAPAVDTPPIFGRWGNLYALVLVVLLAVILALEWLTRSFE